ncbi:TIM21-domain-containing protein [Lipomyces japonicus]|uniref:TIM21-domain-containing protein n=1 Tax=Lipomyces japonicus TaxID=56871 RepID=UPI0034CEE0B2
MAGRQRDLPAKFATASFLPFLRPRSMPFRFGSARSSQFLLSSTARDSSSNVHAQLARSAYRCLHSGNAGNFRILNRLRQNNVNTYSLLVARACRRRTYSTQAEQPQANTKPAEPLGARAARLIKKSIEYSFYTGIVAFGFGLSGLVIYYLFINLISPSGDLQIQNKTSNIIIKNRDVQALVGAKMTVHGESSSNKWSRNRPVALTRVIDKRGIEHILMRFYVEGDLGEGTVLTELTKNPDDSAFQYKYLHVVVGDKIVKIIEDPQTLKKRTEESGGIKFMGVKIWPLVSKPSS